MDNNKFIGEISDLLSANKLIYLTNLLSDNNYYLEIVLNSVGWLDSNYESTNDEETVGFIYKNGSSLSSKII